MKEEQRLKTIRDALLALIAVTVGGLVAAYLFDCYYDLNDDVLIKDLLSGTYTGKPEARNIQMLYPVGALISMFYRLVPSLPWYGIFLCACHFLCVFLIAKRTISFTAVLWKKCVLLITELVLLGGLLMYEFTFVQYTVTSALLTATGIFLFYTTDDRLETEQFLKKNIVSICLVILAFYIRTEMMLLLCPLVGAAGFSKWMLGSRKSGSRPFYIHNAVKYLTVAIAVVIGMGMGMIADKVAYRSDEWREFRAFFDYRTELYDFQQTPPSYEENEAFYRTVGLSEAEEYLLTNYNFALDDKIDSKVLSNIVDYNRIYLGKHYFRYDFYEGLKQYFYRLTHTEDAPWIYLVWMLYALVLITGLFGRTPNVFWKLPLLFGMRSVSWMYIILRGRIVTRITVSLYLTECLILFGMLLMETYRMFDEYRAKAALMLKNGQKGTPYIPQYRKFWPYTMMLLLIALSAIPIMRNMDRVEDQQEYRESINREWDLLREYFMENEDNYYLLDVYSTVQYSEKMFVDADNSYRNYDICGGWAAGSPAYREKMAKRGIGDLESDLMNMNNVYFVTRIDRDMDWFVAYYKSKGYDIRLDTQAAFYVDGKIRFMIYHVRLYQFLG